jgi:hypothetical protein
MPTYEALKISVLKIINKQQSFLSIELIPKIGMKIFLKVLQFFCLDHRLLFDNIGNHGHQRVGDNVRLHNYHKCLHHLKN